MVEMLKSGFRARADDAYIVGEYTLRRSYVSDSLLRKDSFWWIDNADSML